MISLLSTKGAIESAMHVVRGIQSYGALIAFNGLFIHAFCEDVCSSNGCRLLLIMVRKGPTETTKIPDTRYWSTRIVDPKEIRLL